MYRRYRLLELKKFRPDTQPQPDGVNLEAMPVVDWVSRYRLQSSGQGLASCSGLDEEAFLTIQQALQLNNDSSAMQRSPLLLAGPTGSGKTHLVNCLAAERSTDLIVLRVPASVLLNSDGETRQLFQQLQQQQQQQQQLQHQKRYLLAIDNVEMLLDGDSIDANSASRILAELTDCLLSSRRLSVVLVTQRPWLLMRHQPRLCRLFRNSTVCLSRPPDRAERHRILTGLAKRPDAFAPFQASLKASDFFGKDPSPVAQAILAASDGMSPRDLVCVLHQAANYPIKQLVYKRVRLVQEDEHLQFRPEDIDNVLAECQYSVSDDVWREYSSWIVEFVSQSTDEADHSDYDPNPSDD